MIDLLVRNLVVRIINQSLSAERRTNRGSRHRQTDRQRGGHRPRRIPSIANGRTRLARLRGWAHPQKATSGRLPVIRTGRRASGKVLGIIDAVPGRSVAAAAPRSEAWGRGVVGGGASPVLCTSRSGCSSRGWLRTTRRTMTSSTVTSSSRRPSGGVKVGLFANIWGL